MYNVWRCCALSLIKCGYSASGFHAYPSDLISVDLSIPSRHMASNKNVAYASIQRSFLRHVPAGLILRNAIPFKSKASSLWDVYE